MTKAACVALLLALTACTPPPVSTPPAERFAPVATPALPQGEAACDDDGDGVTEPCLSDRQFGALFDEVLDALERANSKLQWLSDYYQPEGSE